MPTHDQLLDAEIAFILYNGQVYTSHPTDRDVSLVKLVKQVETLNHLPPDITAGIDGFLKGGPVPPGLELVGRYNMTNGRMAPYGPVNSPENQETVRQSLQQALYNAPERPQEPVSAPGNSNLESYASQWKTTREFMPLVRRVGQDNCPFCSQKRTLYHMKDGYMAQAMGLYGHGLCRDCLTTRMDQHEITTGQRITHKISLKGFRLVSADVNELASKAFQRVWLNQVAPIMKSVGEQEEKWKQETPEQRLRMSEMPEWKLHRHQMQRNSWIINMYNLLLKRAPETYKLFPWLASRWKKDRGQTDIMNNDSSHVKDIMQQATVHLGKLRDDPRSDIQVPDVNQFKSFQELESWVYEMNSNYQDEASQAAEHTVFEWPDGWTIKELGSDALAREGDLMGHCVGGYCGHVDAGDSHIYSLRDPKNQPHVTFEVEGQQHYEPIGHPGSPEVSEHEELAKENPLDLSGEYYHNQEGTQVYTPVQRPPLTAPPYPGFSGTHTSPDPSEGYPAWEIIQIQGKQDTEPIDEYKKRIQEFFVHLQDNEGVEMKWGYDPYRGDIEIDDARELDEWYENLSSEQKRDHYGLPKKDDDPYVRNWDDLVHEVLYACSDEYDRSKYRGNWKTLAPALYALMLKMGMSKDLITSEIEKMEESLTEWGQSQSDAYWGEIQKGAEERFEKKLEAKGIEVTQNEYHPYGPININEYKDQHEDDWYESIQEEEEEMLGPIYEGSWKLVNYIYWLNESGHREPVGPMPSYEEVGPKPVETDLPGALSAWVPL